MSATPRGERGGRSLWVAVGLALMVAGAVVAVLGLWAGVTAMLDRQDLADYADARNEATERLDAGNQAVALGQQLCDCDTQSRDLADQQIEALRDSDIATYNSLNDQLNDLAASWNELLPQLEALLQQSGVAASEAGA